MPLGNTILSAAEAAIKIGAAIGVALFYAAIIVAYARSRGNRS